MCTTTIKNMTQRDLSFNDLRPYTIEELDARLEEAENDFAKGRYYTREEAHREMRRFIASL